MSNIKNIKDKANNTKDLQGLIEIWNEVANDKYSYSLTQLQIINNYIRELTLIVKGCDLEKGKFYYELNKMLI